MALDAELEAGAADFILCLNDIVPAGSTFAQALAYLLSAPGVANTCLKEIIIECSSQLDPGDIKELIVRCLEGPDSPIDKAFIADAIQNG